MSHSVAEELRRDLECEDLLECVHGLTGLDRACFDVLVEARDPRTIDEIAGEVDRERSTVYRSVHRLLDAGLLEKEQVNYENGGYFHVYRPVDPETVADQMAQLVEQWSRKMTGLLEEFREKYGQRGSVESIAE